jgi:hypothetical protein
MNTQIIRKLSRGVTISFDGNEENEQRACNALGLPLTQADLTYILMFKWVWKIEMTVISDNNDYERNVSMTFTEDTPSRLDDLTDKVIAKRTIAVIEAEGYKYLKTIWKAKIIK